jgi:general secretion pathway protein D
MRAPKNGLCSGLLLLILLQACTTQAVNEGIMPLLREPKLTSTEPEQDSRQQEQEAGIEVRRGRIFSGKTQFSTGNVVELPVDLPNGEFSAGYNNMPIDAFINEVFGDQLRLSFSIDPLVQQLKDLISLRLIDKVDSARLFSIASETLAAYGVSITEQQGLYVFSYSESATASSVPLVVTGLALPDVPVSHRPLFVSVPIKVVDLEKVMLFLESAFRGQDISIQPINIDSSMLLKGKRSIIDQALAMIKVLDNLESSTKFTVIIEPSSGSNQSLASDMIAVLRAEGYNACAARQCSTQILALSTGKLIILASDKKALEHSVDWARELDKTSESEVEDGIFSYQVRHTNATDIVGLIESFSGTRSKEGETSGPREFVADKNRNAVLYKGPGKRWLELLPMMKKMDRPAPSVLVEVILAEITLGDSLQTGVEFIARAGNVAYTTSTGSAGGGLVATLNRAGETRAVVNAFYSDSRSNIRSRPRLMVKSGEMASIDVGNEIPTIVGSSQSVDNPGAPLIQTVKYRKTGVLLTVKPIVYSSDSVEIQINQELSEAQTTKSSSIESPTIFNRKLETTVILKDGGSVVLGGLISETQSKGKSGVPGFGAIPLLGRIFRSDVTSTDRTELVMMIVPYIIENPKEAHQITEKILQVYEMSR